MPFTHGTGVRFPVSEHLIFFFFCWLPIAHPYVMLPLWSSGRDAAADTATVVWRQVLLLGFDTAGYMKREGIRDADALGPKMFMSQSPNKAGLFCVLHFLFGVIDPAYTQVLMCRHGQCCWFFQRWDGRRVLLRWGCG